jgi:integrase
VAKREPNKIKFNDLIIKNLKKATRPYLVWDLRQHGLAIQVQPSGNKAWKCIYSRHGRPRWYSIGRADAIGLSDARNMAGEIMVQVAKGQDPQADRKAKRTSGTFEELATAYVEQHAKRENKSWKQADALVRKRLLPRWGKLKAADIARSDVNAMMGRIDAPIVANQTLAAASAIFTWAIKKELAGVKINPCLGVDRNKAGERERILEDSEIPKFWAAFDKVGLVEAMALKMILITGQRPGEVSHMRSEHIKDGWWTMPGQPVPELRWPGTKNGATHRVWLPAPAQKILSEMDATGLVFAGPRGSAIEGFDKAMRAVCKELGVERATPHDLRRTHGSAITGLGFGRDAMNRVQNHKEGGIADVYDRHEYADENKKVMEAVANKIMSLIDGRGAGNVIAFGKK